VRAAIFAARDSRKSGTEREDFAADPRRDEPLFEAVRMRNLKLVAALSVLAQAAALAAVLWRRNPQ